MKSIIFIGMGVYKNTYNLCAVYGTTAEVLGETKIVSNI